MLNPAAMQLPWANHRHVQPFAAKHMSASGEQLRLPPIATLLAPTTQDAIAACGQGGRVAPGYTTTPRAELPPPAGGAGLPLNAAELLSSPGFDTGSSPLLDATADSSGLVPVLLQVLQREVMRSQMLQAQILLQQNAPFDESRQVSWPAQTRWPGHAVMHRFDESAAAGDKRSRNDADNDVLLHPDRKRRVCVKMACDSYKRSHIACDEGQPCRNCARRGCRCVRSQPNKPSPARSSGKAMVCPVVSPSNNASAGTTVANSPQNSDEEEEARSSGTTPEPTSKTR